ncbi:MAG: hypothetical protein H6560_28865 [Lewinellaceae bacterium]|nr:hypothetical protein [Lewinellaceae bacterium]
MTGYLLKVLLSMQRNTIPPNINLKEYSPPIMAGSAGSK